MNDDEIRISIAEACGWKLVPRIFHNGQWRDVPTWVERKFYDGKPDDYCMAGQVLGGFVPPYTTDLNAMAAAEKTLIFSKRKLFRQHLQMVMTLRLDVDGVIAIEECIHATARDRAEAFLKATGRYAPQSGPTAPSCSKA